MLIALLGVTPIKTLAYGTDVHFNLTYVLCRLADLPAEDALWIAAANQSMDDNDSTTAFSNVLAWASNSAHFTKNGELWHVLCDDGAVSDTINPKTPANISYQDGGKQARRAISKRLEALWNQIPQINTKDPNSKVRANIAFGQYLHARQDFYSHRQMSNFLDDENYLPYGKYWGHSFDGHTPDYVATRPQLAYLMIQDSFRKIILFRTKKLSRVLPQKPLAPDHLLNLLIDALLPCYYEEIRVSETIERTIVSPNQRKVNDALRFCIQSHLQAYWSGALGLPSYSLALKLPYDEHSITSLDSVKRRISLVVKTECSK